MQGMDPERGFGGGVSQPAGKFEQRILGVPAFWYGGAGGARRTQCLLEGADLSPRSEVTARTGALA
jgi:hypothetical protein